MKNNQIEVESRSTDDRLRVRGNSGKKTKDPNKPKRPPSPFFVFLDEFRREFNVANPDNKSVSIVGKAAGKKWKSMTQEEKEPFVAKANSKKSEYAVTMQQYRMELANGTKAPGDDSDQTNSEVNEANGIKTSGDDSDKAHFEVNEANGTKGPGDDSDKTSSEVNEANGTKTPGDGSDKTNSEVNEEKLVGGSEEEKDDA